MIFHSATFTKSSAELSQCPSTTQPEYAFIGRSNVGKSSLINMLTSRKALAKTSGRPGKTQLINHFHINEEWYLVDLPGYGYAKVSKKERAKWSDFTYDYLQKRENLYCLFVLIDSRHEPQKVDLEFLMWLGEHNIPFVIAFTKADKLNKNQLQKNLVHYEQELLNYWEELPQRFVTSAETKAGQEEILNFIEATNKS